MKGEYMIEENIKRSKKEEEKKTQTTNNPIETSESQKQPIHNQ